MDNDIFSQQALQSFENQLPGIRITHCLNPTEVIGKVLSIKNRDIICEISYNDDTKIVEVPLDKIGYAYTTLKSNYDIATGLRTINDIELLYITLD